MSIVYRPHRGLLVDAMAEVKHFSCIEDMIRYVKDDWGRYYSDVDVIVDNKEIDDPRIGWHHTRYVCIKNNSFEFPQCVGMCDLVTFNKEVYWMMETTLKWHKAEEEIPNKRATVIFRTISGFYMVGTVDSTTPYHEFLFSVKMNNLSYFVDKYGLWAYFTPPKEKEFHVYLNKTCATDYYSYLGTLEAINDERSIIKTTQLSLLSTSLLEKYRVFLHKDNKQIEITLGDCQGTDRNIKATDNLEKLVMAGEFNFE